MEDLLLKIVQDLPYTEQDVESALYDLCNSRNKGGCHLCPVYIANGNKEPVGENGVCKVILNGGKMFSFIREHF